LQFITRYKKEKPLGISPRGFDHVWKLCVVLSFPLSQPMFSTWLVGFLLLAEEISIPSNELGGLPGCEINRIGGCVDQFSHVVEHCPES
jgi:hypothetical protein